MRVGQEQQQEESLKIEKQLIPDLGLGMVQRGWGKGASVAEVDVVFLKARGALMLAHLAWAIRPVLRMCRQPAP